MKKSMKKFLCMLMVMTMIFGVTNGIVLAEGTEATKTVSTEAAAPVVEQVENVIDILTVNDFHGNVKESGKNVGMAKMVGYVIDQRAVNPNTFVVSGGDSYQGSALSNLTYGAPVSEMYKGMGVIASSVGNHEFDWGVERINKWSKDGGFPFLAANIVEKESGEPVSWAQPYLIQEMGGIKVAFIGLTTVETAVATKAENIASLKFTNAGEAAAKWVEFLKAGKAEEGTPDVIIALTHVASYQDRETKDVSGLDNELEEITLVDGIDGVISGHSHQTVAGVLNGVPVVQAYKYGRAMGKMSIELNEDKTVKAITPSVEMLYKLSSDLVREDETTKAAYDKFEEEFAPIANEVVGQLKGTLTHGKESNVTPLGYWTSEVMRKATNVQVGLQNGGGLRRTLEEGNITMGDLYEVMPFDNALVTMEVTGAHLKALVDHGIDLEGKGDGQFAGIKVKYDPSKPYESKVLSITLDDGTPVEMDKTYTLVTNDFILTGGDGYDFKAAKNVVNTYVPIRDALVDEIKAAGTVVAPSVDDVLVAEEAAVETYVISEGDVLWKIAESYGTTYEVLAEMNNLSNPHLIFAGKTLVVPAK